MWNWEKGVKGEFIISIEDAKPVIFIVSDSIGETAELVARAAAIQFNHGGVEIRRLSYVSNPNEIPEIIEEASSFNCVIAYTLVIPELKRVLVREAAKYDIPTVDVLTPMLEAVSQLVNRIRSWSLDWSGKWTASITGRLRLLSLLLNMTTARTPGHPPG